MLKNLISNRTNRFIQLMTAPILALLTLGSAVDGLESLARADDEVQLTQAHALIITTDAFSGTFFLDFVRDPATGELTQLSYQTPCNPNGVLTLADLSRGPQVLLNEDGHDVLFVTVESDFNAAKGGHANVRFLSNGMSGTYKNFRISIDVGASIVLRSDPNSSDSDSDGNSYTSVFNQIFMARNAMFGKTVGIAKITPSLQ